MLRKNSESCSSPRRFPRSSIWGATLGLLLLTLPAALHAQVDLGPCDTCWDGFVPNFDFKIYGHIVTDHGYAHDQFHFDGAQIYQKDVADISQLVNDTSASSVVWIADSTHPWGGFWNDDAIDPGRSPQTIVLPGQVYEIKTISDYLNRVGFQDAIARGYGMIVVPTPIGNFKAVVRTVENFLVLPTEYQNLSIGANPVLQAVPDSVKENQTTLTNWLRSQYTSLAGEFFSAYKLSGSATPDTVLIAGRPSYVANTFYAIQAYRTDPKFMQFLYDPAYHYWTDESGNPRTQSETDSILAERDLRPSFEIEFALRTNLDSLQSDDIGNNAVIAYAPLYYREIMEDRLQLDTTIIIEGENIVTDTIHYRDSCFCDFMRPFDTIVITKKLYLERFSDATNKYVAHKDGRNFDIDKALWYYDIGRNVDLRDSDTALINSIITHGPGGVSFIDSITLQYDSILSSELTVPATRNIPHPGITKCDSLLAARLAIHPDSANSAERLPPGTRLENFPAESNFNYELFSTRIVPIDFYRNSIRHQSFALLRDGLGAQIFDTIIANIYADPLTDSLISQIGVLDEPTNFSLRTYGLLSSQMQQAMERHSVAKDRPKPIWTNPAANYSSFPLLGGDYDSTTFRMVQTSARQDYAVFGHHPTPVMYANPDSLGVRAWDTMYITANNFIRHISSTNDTTYTYPEGKQWVAGNNAEDYNRYTRRIQGEIFGNFYNRYGATVGETITGTSWIVDVMQIRYGDRFPHLPSTPVWNVIQTHGRPNIHGDTIEALGQRHTTPEEMIAMAWLSMNSGANGVVFGDFQFDGENSGLLTQFIQHEMYDNLEYGTYRFPNQSGNQDANPAKRVDSMWLGFRTRHAGLREVTGELKFIDSVIGWKNLHYNLEQISLNDLYDSATGKGHQRFDEIPMLANLKAERAKRYDVTWDSGAGRWMFEGSDTLDAIDSTLIEVTHFTDVTNPVGHALLITNRRTWPVDFTHYGTRAQDRFADYAPLKTFDTVGLGAIDVRRPIIVLVNNSDILADSVLIERISPSSTWSTTAAFGDTVTLEWMLPGRGHLYRLTPKAAFISEHGTAYNNAVRSENPSTPTTTLDRLVVYERDSVIYARAVDSVGAWSREVMISDPDDTVLVSDSRVAKNFFPALAVSRGGLGVTRFVWERDSAGLRSVQSAQLLQNTPLSRIGLDTLNSATDVYRHQLSVAAPLTGPPAMTPAIVSVVDTKNEEAGFIISWAEQDSGVTVMALREWLITNGLLGTDDSATLRDVYSTEITGGNQICQYPTLANVPTYDRFNVNPGRVSGTAAEIDSISDLAIAIPANWQFYNLAYLAYQQGAGGNRQLGERIYYHRIGANFHDLGTPPSLWVDVAEQVTKNIPACGFYHPSIAADSVRVGVAFEVFEANNEQINIGLRFRDTSGVNTSTGQPLKEWETNLYRWGGPLKQNGGWIFVASEYVRPSLTEFPSMDSTSLDVQPEGGLSWFWQDEPNGRAHPQYLYRYGWFEPREIGDGKDPGMTLVPVLESNPFEETSIFHRSDDSSRVVGENLEGNNVWQFPARLLNTPGNPLPQLFAGIPATGGIIAHAQLAGNTPYCDVQFPMKFQWGLAFGHETVDHPDDDRHVPGDPPSPNNKPGLPPTFFNGAKEGKTVVDDLGNAEEVVRTGLFMKGGGPVKIRRIVAAGDSIANMLNGMPWDTERSAPANIYNVVEVVRAADSVVLWRSDTITARGLDTLDTYVNEELEIPSYLLGSSGTVLWCRMRTFTSAGISYDVSGGFTFYREDSTSFALPKGVSPWQYQERGGSESLDASLSVRVVPNPAREKGEIRVWVSGGGEVRVGLWSVLGEPIAELPNIVAEGEGEYRVEIDLSSLPGGTYLIKGERGGTIAVERFVVVR